MSAPARFRQIPSVTSLLARDDIRSLLAHHPRAVVLGAIRRLLDGYRAEASGEEGSGRTREEWTSRLIAALPAEVSAGEELSLRRVINATGIVVHTNLGRAPLPKEAIRAISETASGYSNLEFDLAGGTRSRGRGDRGRASRGGGAHAPPPPRRLREGDRPLDCAAPEGPPVQLPHHGVHGGGNDLRPCRPRGEARRPRDGRTRVRGRFRFLGGRDPRDADHQTGIGPGAGNRYRQRRQAPRRAAGRGHRGPEKPPGAAEKTPAFESAPERQVVSRRTRGHAPAVGGRKAGDRTGAGTDHDDRGGAGGAWPRVR